MDKIDKSSIRPGDVLLHRTRGEISKLVAWAGDSPYSHAAIVYDGDNLREAISKGVVDTPIAERLAMTDKFDFIDVYRRADAPAGLADMAMLAVRAVADGYSGKSYPLNELWYLGLVCAIRDKVPLDPPVKELLREITDMFIDHDPSQQVCSEFVYRCYAEAQTYPSIKPRIVVTSGPHESFPAIDLFKLYEEYEEAKGNAEPHARAAARMRPAVGHAPVTDRELRARYAKVKAQVGDPVIDGNPNPRTILPADIQNSPDFKAIGRVLVGD